MTVVSLFASALIAWSLLVRSGSELVERIDRIAPSAFVARSCALGIVALYGAQLSLLALQSRFENVSPAYAWMKTLPLPVFDDRADSAPLHFTFTALGLGLALLESFALAVMVLALRRDRSRLSLVMVTFLGSVMAALSLAAPVMSTTDPYEYVATGIIGFHSYALRDGEFVHTAYAAYAKHIPVNRVVYGPLWMAVEVALAKLGSTIYEKIEVIRLLNVGLVAAFLWLLGRASLSRATLVAFALNPALWFYAVANPHAEIEGLACLAGAYVFARRSNSFVATLLLIAAGLIKLPFVIIGATLLAPLPERKRRCIAWVVAVGIVLAMSYFLPGPAYVANMSRFAANGAHANWSLDWLAIAPIAAVATIVVLLFRRGTFGVAWLFHQMAPLAAPWYLFWGIPYALATGSIEAYVVSFPLAATQAERLSGISACLLIFTVIGLAYDALRSHRRQRQGVAAPAP